MKNGMGGARSKQWGQESWIQVFGGEIWGKDDLEDLDVDGRIVLKCAFKKWDGGMDWIQPAQDRDRWLAVVNAVIDLCFP